MKPLLIILTVGSIALNLLLVGMLFAGRTVVESTPPAGATSTVPKASPEKAPSWTDFQTEDLPAMVQNLRNHGFPPHLVRAVTAGRIREMYAARFRALDPNSDSRPFWQSTAMDTKLMQQQRQLYREQQQALRALLGPEADQSDVNALYQGRRFDSVPPEKADDVRRILRDYDDRRSELFTGALSGSAEQSRKVNALEQEQRDALAAVLTPQEFEAFQLRNSDTARNLRSQLSAFNPSEEEFRTLYKFQSEFGAQYGRLFGIPSTEEQQRRSAAQRQMNEQIMATLGPVRGAEYERSNDYYFRQTSQLVNRLELPAETTTQIWGVKQDIEKRAAEIRRDQSLPPDDRTKQLAVLAQEAAANVTPLLGGARGLEAYQQNGGSWIQSLTARPGVATGTTRIITAPPR